MMLFAEDFIITVYSVNYVHSVPIFRIFLLLLPLRITAYSSLLMATGRSMLVFRATCGTLIADASLNLLLIPRLGISGSAVASVVAVYLLSGCQLWWCTQLLEANWGWIFPWPILGRLAMISALASGVAWLSNRSLICGVLRGGIGLMVFGGWSHRYCGFSAGSGRSSATF